MNSRPFSPGLAHRAWDDLPDLLSLLAFFTATALLFRSVEFALIVTASLGFHELGHVALIAYFKLDWRITFGFAGAWTSSRLDARARLSNLANSGIHLAGPAFSLLLALAAALLGVFCFPNDPYLLRLTNFSATVALLNLLPLGSITDGGKVLRRAGAALRGRARAWVVILPLLFTLGLLALTLLADVHIQDWPLFACGLLLAGLWMALSVLRETHPGARARKAQYAGAPGPLFVPVTSLNAGPAAAQAAPARRMSRRQAFLVVLMVWALLALALVLAARTPFWLAPDYLLGIMRNVLDALGLLAGLAR